MTNQTPPKDPVAEVMKEVNALQREINELQAKVRLKRVRDSLEDLQSKIAAMPGRLKDLRARGYPFEKALEAKAEELGRHFDSIRSSVMTQIDQQSLNLERSMRPIEDDFRRLMGQVSSPEAARPLLNQVKSAVSSLEGKVEAVAGTINGMFDELGRQMRDIENRVGKADWTLKQLSEAGFRLLPTEAPIRAVKATWVKGEKADKDDPQGVLYLTDQRLLFEQKQDVATKKVLFITTKKERVQNLLLETPVGTIDSAKASKRGLLGHEDHLEVKFTYDAAVPLAHFHLDGQDSNEWQGLLGKAKAHEFDTDRVTPVDQAAVEKVRTAPTACPYCGGAITTQIVRGMDSIKCEYCGKLIRL
ncbi:MAG: hypothetical protein BWY10_01463 [Chloroflexi bacterium ADurb.Bin180]|nr:MAG: hypothetical protein BWY10_01463 [Chloroflexi bacterium ADurb.Bin180]